MKVTGYQLREALRNWHTRLDVLNKQFRESLWQFPDSEQPADFKPDTLAAQFAQADDTVAALENAQQVYNQKITVTIAGRKVPLSYAVKRVGGAGRLEKMWRWAATDNGRDRYSYRETSRKSDEVYAKRMASMNDCVRAAEKTASLASELRSAIAAANATEIDLEVNPEWFK